MVPKMNIHSSPSRMGTYYGDRDGFIATTEYILNYNIDDPEKLTIDGVGYTEIRDGNMLKAFKEFTDGHPSYSTDSVDVRRKVADEFRLAYNDAYALMATSAIVEPQRLMTVLRGPSLQDYYSGMRRGKVLGSRYGEAMADEDVDRVIETLMLTGDISKVYLDNSNVDKSKLGLAARLIQMDPYLQGENIGSFIQGFEYTFPRYAQIAYRSRILAIYSDIHREVYVDSIRRVLEERRR